MIHPLLADTAQQPLRLLAVVELGSHWGHLLRLLPLVRALRRRGHKVTLIAPNAAAAQALYRDEGIGIAACPAIATRPEPGARTPPRSYADLLERHAFGHDTLDAALRQWGSLLQRWQPHAMLTDFAPRALLAAHLHRLPVVQVAIGWEAPPSGAALPGIHPWQPADPPAMQASEARLLDRINRRCVTCRVLPFERVSDLYATGTQFLATWPEADHFGPRDGARYIVPVYATDHGRAVGWPAPTVAPSGPGRTRRVLVYLSPDARNTRVLDALRRLSAQVIAVLPGAGTSPTKPIVTSSWTVSNDPVQLGGLLESADLVISNAGHGLTLAGLQAGVPSLVLPRTAEHGLATMRLASTGAVRSLTEAVDAGRHAELIEEVLEGTSVRTAACALAGKYAGATQFRTVLGVVHAMERAGTSYAPAGA
jgi:UDP:flavonoid glycosyltransferase YjiC (YdhE family)